MLLSLLTLFMLIFFLSDEDNGIGARMTVIIQNMANFASSMLVSFIQNWQLTLMMLAAGPIMASVMFYMNKVMLISGVPKQFSRLIIHITLK